MSRIVKDSNNEISVPREWRQALKNIADNLTLGLPIEEEAHVFTIPMARDAKRISLENIKSYPEEFGSLVDTTWSTSVCFWCKDYWGVIIDLYNQSGEPTDLVLDARIYEDGHGYRIEPYLVYVP